LNILITGGGTGGHLRVAQSLGRYFYEQKHIVYYIGSVNGQDIQWFENADFVKASYFLKTSGVVNKNFAGKIFSLGKIGTATLKARKILKNRKIDAVVSVGGFSAAAASFAAVTLGIPFFIHEQNARIGRLNKLLKPFAKEFFSSYDEINPVEYPVENEFFSTRRIRGEVKKVIFLGGSQGASFINDFAIDIAPRLKAMGIKIAHQCGNADFQKLMTSYKKMDIDVELAPFWTDLPKRLSEADMAISRAGASTLWELSANAIPTFFIPYPYAAGDHQYHNAAFLVEQNAGWMARQSDLKEEQVLSVLLGDVTEQSQKLAELVQKNGTPIIAQKILDRIS